jgi:site-specific DNA-methyltransferase (adenine-specific)
MMPNPIEKTPEGGLPAVNCSLILGDCLEKLKDIPDGSIDMILCDLPYGTTACKWDTIIPFEPMWGQYRRIVRSGGAIVLTAAQPFTSALVMSASDLFKYSLVWRKSRVSHFAQAPYRFLTEHEDILVFSDGGTSKNAKTRMTYNPQGVSSCERICKGKGHSDHRPSAKRQADYVQTVTGYPKSILDFASDTAKAHPTQKPVALMEYLIRTYTNEGETVLDNCMGSGTTGVACVNTNRNFIGIELDADYFNIAEKRIADAQNKPKQISLML